MDINSNDTKCGLHVNGMSELVLKVFIKMIPLNKWKICHSTFLRIYISQFWFLDNWVRNSFVVTQLHVARVQYFFSVLERLSCVRCNTFGCKNVCSKCRAPYCSQECQSSDWSQHKLVCKDLIGKGQISLNTVNSQPIVTNGGSVKTHLVTGERGS